MSNRSKHICGTSHDNRRQTERNEACFNCRGAKEEKQSLKEPSAKESGTAQWSLTRPSGWIVKAAKPQTPIVECEIQIIIETNNDESWDYTTFKTI